MLPLRPIQILGLVLAPWTAFAARPEIDDAAWMALPEAERAAFEVREEAIAAADAEVDAARLALDREQSVELGERSERDAEYVSLMEARGAVATAELELDKARAVGRAGTTVDLGVFEVAAASAQWDLAHAEHEVAVLAL